MDLSTSYKLFAFTRCFETYTHRSDVWYSFRPTVSVSFLLAWPARSGGNMALDVTRCASSLLASSWRSAISYGCGLCDFQSGSRTSFPTHLPNYDDLKIFHEKNIQYILFCILPERTWLAAPWVRRVIIPLRLVLHSRIPISTRRFAARYSAQINSQTDTPTEKPAENPPFSRQRLP